MGYKCSCFDTMVDLYMKSYSLNIWKTWYRVNYINEGLRYKHHGLQSNRRLTQVPLCQSFSSFGSQWSTFFPRQHLYIEQTLTDNKAITSIGGFFNSCLERLLYWCEISAACPNRHKAVTSVHSVPIHPAWISHCVSSFWSQFRIPSRVSITKIWIIQGWENSLACYK